jgi:hypothetical protein
MLPKQLTDLTDGFVKAFDSERPPVIEFRKIHNKGAASAVQSGVGWGGGASLGVIAKGLTEYLREKALFVSDKLQQVVTSTEIAFYAELNTDLKSQFAAYLNPCLKGAEDYFETLRKSSPSPTGFTDQLRMNLNSIMPSINADLDLFCVEYEVKERNRKRMNTPNIIYNLHGQNARVNQGSVDYSVNIASSQTVFSEIKKTIESGIEDEELKQQLLTKTAELEQNVGKPSFAKKYAEFIACAANHMKLLGPWIPALTQWLTGP